MKLLGLTGGIGMGKSAAAEVLTKLSASVVDTDALARLVVEPGQPALLEIQQRFGAQILDGAGQLRRDELAKVIFSDPEAREQLERILHPRIQTLWKQQLDVWRARQKDLAVVVIPLLFETGAEKEFDSVVCVACSTATQRLRLRARGWDDRQMDQRIASQWPIEKKMTHSDFVIWNEAGLEVLSEQLERVIR
jgi:dephospho-CoA kinase